MRRLEAKDRRGRGRRQGFGGDTRLRRSRGQSLIIFALSFTVLLSLAGLAVDTLRAFDLYGRMQRAAEAGALAGVLYMPSYYNAARPGDPDSAVSRAMKEVIKNGFGAPIGATASACPTNATLAVQICVKSGTTNQLQVTITEQLNLVLMSALGVGPTTLSATAAAEYLPAIQLGSRQNYFGDQVECVGSTSPCSITAPGTHLQYFLAALNGPAETKEQGDPYVYCEEGPSSSASRDGSATVSPLPYNGYSTNHPAYSDSITKHCGLPGTGGNPGNPNQQPAGFSGPATASGSHPGGYNYLISVPAGISGATAWVYNPSYIPSGSSSSIDQFLGADNANYFRGPNNEGLVNRFDRSHFDAPLFYFTTTFTVYQVNSLYDRSSDTQVASVAYPPYDAMSSDLSAHGCYSASEVYDPYWQQGSTPNTYHGTTQYRKGCFALAQGTTGSASPNQSGAPAPCWLAWCKLPVTLNGGATGATYRLVVEATGLTANASPDYNSGPTDGYGSHNYALKICATVSGGNPIGCSSGAAGGNPGVSIYGWNNEDVVFMANLSQNTPDKTNPATACVTSNATPYTCLDLGCVPTAYAGRTINVGLYDPGDGSGDMYIGIIPPPGSGATVAYTSPTVTPTTIDGDRLVQARFNSPGSGYNALNGLWLTATLTLPSTYTGDCQTNGSGWWQIVYASASGTPHDKVGVSFSLVGSPVHLIPLG